MSGIRPHRKAVVPRVQVSVRRGDSAANHRGEALMPVPHKYTLHDSRNGQCVSFYLTGPNKGLPCIYEGDEVLQAEIAMRAVGVEAVAHLVPDRDESEVASG